MELHRCRSGGTEGYQERLTQALWVLAGVYMRLCVRAVQMDVQAGVGYGIVVDGFAGNFGTFEITVSATKVLSPALRLLHTQ